MHKLVRAHYREALPDERTLKEIAAIYWVGLHDLDDAAFTRAVRAAIGSITFFPKVAELRALAGRAAPKGDFDDPAIRAKYLPGGQYGALFWPEGRQSDAVILARLASDYPEVIAPRRWGPPPIPISTGRRDDGSNA